MGNLDNNDYRLARHKMVEEQIKARGIKDKRVLEAMSRIPRHLFIEEAMAARAYSDHPLPIGEQQTISQPYIVALMTEALDLTGPERVLEIGTGSGYQAAILSQLAQRVYSVERIRTLMISARKIMDRLGCRNVVLTVGDGTRGWPEQGPFDAIMVTAGGPDVPPPLLEQLTLGGRLVIPIGKSRLSQDLIKVVKNKNGLITRKNLGGCRFVDLVGEHAWSDDNGYG